MCQLHNFPAYAEMLHKHGCLTTLVLKACVFVFVIKMVTKQKDGVFYICARIDSNENTDPLGSHAFENYTHTSQFSTF